LNFTVGVYSNKEIAYNDIYEFGLLNTDLGAYEYGGTDWVVGCTLSEKVFPARASDRMGAEGMKEQIPR
jgi:hypothetical protein